MNIAFPSIRISDNLRPTELLREAHRLLNNGVLLLEPAREIYHPAPIDLAPFYAIVMEVAG